MENFDDFDKNFEEMKKQTKKQTMIMSVIYGTIVISGLGFVAWVIVKLMQHFGII